MGTTVSSLPSIGPGGAPWVRARQHTPGVGSHGVRADAHEGIIQEQVRWAAFLRCSDEELQDPHLSLARQLQTCRAVVDRWGGQVTAIYYEVETGTSPYPQRGSGTHLAGFAIPIPRTGGLHELVADATRRRFDRVVCESISRLARHSAVAFTLEDEFRAAGVGLHCADEPFEESFGSIVLRHLNVGLARGYVFNLKQLARQGAETATQQGWHMGGVPPYGYQLIALPHPNPHKRQRGLVRHTLELDAIRAPVVRRIFEEYLYGGRGLGQIRDLLNADLDRAPPPVPTDPARRASTWSRSSVRSILHNPKYTGYQVYNRRASKTGRGRVNPPKQWIWSDQPAHPAIVSRQEYEQVQTMATQQHSRRGGYKTDYLFRNRITCRPCELRMSGVRRGPYRYYRCQPAHQRGHTPPGHPPTVYLSEHALLEVVTDALAATLYQPEQTPYWQQTLTTPAPDSPAAILRMRLGELQRSIAELNTRIRRQVRSLEEDDLEPAARQAIAARIAELHAELSSQQQTLTRLREQPTAEKSMAAPIEGPQTLFPISGAELRETPKRSLGELFASLGLTVNYDHTQHTAHLFILLPDDPYHPPPSQPPPTDSPPIPPARSHRRPPPRRTLHIHLVTGVEGQRLRAYQATTLAQLLHALATRRTPDHADAPTTKDRSALVGLSNRQTGELVPGEDPRQASPSPGIDHLQQRRLAAAQGFADGATQAQVARELGVSAQTASRWHRAWQAGGLQGLRTRRRGPPARLTQRQWHQLEYALAQGANAFGFQGDHWTLTRIAEVVHQLAGVRYHPNYLAALLHQHGWSPHRLTLEADKREQTARTTWAKQP